MFKQFLSTVCLAALLAGPALAGERTLPVDKYPDNVNPTLASKYAYTEDGDYTKALNIPTYQWMPANQPPEGIILAVHGLTLHGRTYHVLARALAVNGIGLISLDMRGFGRCGFDPNNQFSTPKDDKHKVNHEKSYEDIVALATMIKQKYPDLPLMVMGESLGCTFCVRIASEHPDLVQGIMMSAPAVRVNPRMYSSPADIGAGLKALATGSKMNLHGFIQNLVSPRPEVWQEMLDDPMITKELSLGELISTDEFVAKTASYGKGVARDLSVWILQGSSDGCVAPKHLTDLLMAMPSEDQEISWKGKFGHLQLETTFMRAQVIDSLSDWLIDHGKENMKELADVEQCINQLGGMLIREFDPETVKKKKKASSLSAQP